MAHGEFGKWLENIGMHRQQAHQFIKIANEFEKSNVNARLHLGVRALYQLATMPEEERNNIIENGIETENGNKSVENATTREIEIYKKQLKQRDEEKSQLESQLEQAQRSESIARKQLEE